jgi:hypothetical protein
MLVLPEVGFAESVEVHNCSVAVAADWIEASLLEADEEITQPQVADILREQGIYPKRDGVLCADFLATVWGELERRAKLLGSLSCYHVEGMRIQRKSRWQNVIAPAFLLSLSCASYYPALRDLNRGQYVDQGDMFEEFCRLALDGDGWRATRTGWSSQRGAKKLAATVAAAAEALGESSVNHEQVALDRHKNEAGCDLVCHRMYREQWSGRPVVLVQCASGSDFRDKLGTPSIDRWRDYIAFSTIPLRGFCTPQAFQQNEFRQHSHQVKGLLLDRYRLLEPFAHRGLELPPPLARRLKTWLHPRLRILPRLT